MRMIMIPTSNIKNVQQKAVFTLNKRVESAFDLILHDIMLLSGTSIFNSFRKDHSRQGRDICRGLKFNHVKNIFVF